MVVEASFGRPPITLWIGPHAFGEGRSPRPKFALDSRTIYLISTKKIPTHHSREPYCLPRETTHLFRPDGHFSAEYLLVTERQIGVDDDLARTVFVNFLPADVGRAPVVGRVPHPGAEAAVKVPSVVVGHDQLESLGVQVSDLRIRGCCPYLNDIATRVQVAVGVPLLG